VSSDYRGSLFTPLMLLSGLVFGFGLGFSHMARPEVVLNFLQFEDLGLLFVMVGAAVVTGTTFAVATRFLGSAPLTGSAYARRLKSFDRDVVGVGVVFGVGWGVSGICLGLAYASVGIGNYPMLLGVGGMFVDAYLQGRWRERRAEPDGATAVAD
jgi:uncharacterized protein